MTDFEDYVLSFCLQIGIVWTVIISILILFVGSLLSFLEADILLLVAISVTFLSETLIAIFAHEGP